MTPKPDSKKNKTPPVPPPTDGTESAPATPEIGGRKGPEPTRYGDWEMNGKCVDF